MIPGRGLPSTCLQQLLSQATHLYESFNAHTLFDLQLLMGVDFRRNVSYLSHLPLTRSTYKLTRHSIDKIE